MIIPVVMAGGTGSRLWPVSRETFPKQFVSFQDDTPSLFQQSLLRLSGLEDVGPPVVVCNHAHRFIVAEQLQEIGIENGIIILEPMVRNTAPAVALAALAAGDLEKDASLLVLAADHVINGLENFHAAIAAGHRQAAEGKLVTFGLVPRSPHTGYGYIRRGESVGEAHLVAEFVEKPDRNTAHSYFASSEYYWNSGMFMFRAGDYLRELERFAPEILSACTRAWQEVPSDPDFKRVPEEAFGASPNISIDYAVMEHTANAVLVPLDAEWSDLGAWDAVWEKADKDDAGNAQQGDVCLFDVNNSYIHAGSRLVSVIGVEDTVVIETADAVLVVARSHAQNVKEIVEQLRRSERSEADSHHFVRRPWGGYESLLSEEGFQVKRINVNPGAALSLQMHYHRSEHWTIVAGTARVTRGDDVLTLGKNESVYIPAETRHRIENTTDEALVFIEVQCGDYLGEDDIVRFEDKYGRSEPS